jgi:alpha-L-arabinofuranosidase
MNRSQGRSVIKPGLAMRSLLVSFVLVAMSLTGPAIVAQKVELSVDVSKAGAKIDRNIFGQFAEHLGQGIYQGIWVGPDSTIPNTRGIRNDVVGALKVLKVPNVRWPGGCFADEHHWRKGIGAQRVVTLNPNWGGVIEPNSFGTHEFMDFLNQIGSEAYVSVNVGSGTPQEAAEWLEYMTTAQPTTLAKERAVNGHPTPYQVAYLGIGNESWDCGGNMTPDYYLSQLKIYSRFVRKATSVPVAFDAGSYTHGDISLPRVDAFAAKDAAGKLWVAITNLDPNQPVEIEASLAGITAKSATGETLTAPKVDSVNTYDAPNTVVPKPIAAKATGGKLSLKLDTESVTVISVEK